VVEIFRMLSRHTAASSEPRWKIFVTGTAGELWSGREGRKLSVQCQVSRQVFHRAIKSPVRRSEPVTWQVPAVAGCGIATAFKRIVEQLKFPGKRPSSLTGGFSDLGFEEEHGW